MWVTLTVPCIVKLLPVSRIVAAMDWKVEFSALSFRQAK